MSGATSYYFTEEHELFRQSLRSFLEKEVIPFIDEWEEKRQIPRSVWTKMGEMGFLGLGYPEEYGGSDLDFWYDVVFLEEIHKCWSGGFAIVQNVVQYMSSTYINKFGSDFLKDKYMRKIISGEFISAIAITEPGAGSDVMNLQTTATKEGDHYVVNGSKTFITNGVYGDFIVTVVKTDPEAGPAGVSLLVIDRNADGVTANKLKKLGWHASDTAELFFEEVKVPVENLIGEEGQGFYYLMSGLQQERLCGAVGGYTACEEGLNYSLKYMAERSAFGRPINKFQVLRHRAAQLAAEIESTKQFVLHCCRMHNDDQYAVKECSMAKLLATELSDKVATQCLQFFGGYGYMEEYKIARMFRDSRIGTIGGGTSEIMREIIAKIVIDGVSYEMPKMDAPKPKKEAVPAANSKSASTKEDTKEKVNSNETKNNIMSFEAVITGMQERAKTAPALGKTLKFDFGDDKMYVDGTGDANTITKDDKEADCVVVVSLEDFASIASGDLNPMSAVMTGKMKIKGDMSVAMKLQSLL